MHLTPIKCHACVPTGIRFRNTCAGIYLIWNIAFNWDIMHKHWPQTEEAVHVYTKLFRGLCNFTSKSVQSAFLQLILVGPHASESLSYMQAWSEAVVTNIFHPLCMSCTQVISETLSYCKNAWALSLDSNHCTNWRWFPARISLA